MQITPFDYSIKFTTKLRLYFIFSPVAERLIYCIIFNHF